MSTTVFIVGFIAVLIVVVGIFAFSQMRKQLEIQKDNPGHPQGYWTGMGISVGITIGAGVGVALDNIAIGVGIGVAIGVAIGSGMENQHKDEIRPITEEEEKLRKQTLLFITGLLLLSAIVLVAYLLLK